MFGAARAPRLQVRFLFRREYFLTRIPSIARDFGFFASFC